MRAEIIVIGDELTGGRTLDKNSGYISARLDALGIPVQRIQTIGDDPRLIARILKQSLKRSPLVFTTGGLGPTGDDLTLAAVCRALKRKPVRCRQVLAGLESFFKQRHLPLPASAACQAMVPEKSLVLANRVGTAPGLILHHGKALLFVLPGPPPEVASLMEHEILPLLKKWKLRGTPAFIRTIKTISIGESAIYEKIRPLLKQEKDVWLGSYPGSGEVELRLFCRLPDRATTKKKVTRLAKAISRRLKEHVYGYDDDTIESVIGKLLTRAHKTVAVAESCTGGLIGHRITAVAGSSRYFLGGIIAYSNESKIKELGVSRGTLKKHGAVSAETAREMAAGVRRVFKAGYGLAVTGICGPGGGSREKPVGLVYVALASSSGAQCEKHRFLGDRQAIKHRAATAALGMLWKQLRSNKK